MENVFPVPAGEGLISSEHSEFGCSWIFRKLLDISERSKTSQGRATGRLEHWLRLRLEDKRNSDFYSAQK